MSMWAVIGELLHFLAAWIPRPQIVRANEQGIAFWFGKYVRVVKPGYRISWPAIMDLEILPVARQIIQLNPLTLYTKDCKSVIAGAVVVYSITDIRKFLVENHDAEESIVEIAGATLRESIVSKTLEQVQVTDGRASADKTLTKKCAKALADFGVEVETMRLTDFAPTRVLNLVGSDLVNVTTA
tara:strand:- start:26517 stop:27068 length:552 start_codon:yes stop_codon:yes gene_type:complete